MVLYWQAKRNNMNIFGKHYYHKHETIKTPKTFLFIFLRIFLVKKKTSSYVEKMCAE
jgi:hypothetical protein